MICQGGAFASNGVEQKVSSGGTEAQKDLAAAQAELKKVKIQLSKVFLHPWVILKITDQFLAVLFCCSLSYARSCMHTTTELGTQHTHANARQVDAAAQEGMVAIEQIKTMTKELHELKKSTKVAEEV